MIDVNKKFYRCVISWGTRLDLAAGAAQRLHMERLPAYAPAPNPDEGVWQLLKRAELAYQCFPDLPALQTAVEAAMQRVQATPARRQGCLRECAYLA